MNLDNRVVYLNQGILILYSLPNSQPSQNIFQNRDYVLQHPNAVFDITQLVEGNYLFMYRTETPEIRRPPRIQYDIPLTPTLRRIPRVKIPRRGPGRLPPIPPGSEDDKKDKDKKEPPPKIH